LGHHQYQLIQMIESLHWKTETIRIPIVQISWWVQLFDY